MRSKNLTPPTRVRRVRYTVSIMEPRNGNVVHETQYLAGPLWSSGLTKPMGSATPGG